MAKDKHLRAIAAQQSSKAAPSVNITLREAALLGASKEDDGGKPYVSLKYYWPDHECFSSWGEEKLKAFSSFCCKIKQMKWQEIYSSGGKLGHKTGLGYTVHKNHDVLPNHPELKDLSPELTWFELRVDNESRVHGFRVKDAFFLVFLDHAHKVYKA